MLYVAVVCLLVSQNVTVRQPCIHEISGGINVAKILRRLVSVYVGVTALLAVVAAVALELTVVSQTVAITTLLLVLISKLSIGVGVSNF